MSLSFIFPALLWLLLLVPLTWLLAWATRTASRGRHGPVRAATSIAVRSVILASLVLAVAGAQVVWAVRDTAVVFLIDGSASVSPAQAERALVYINAALEAGDQGDQAAVVVFGAEPAVERAATPLTPLRRLTSTVVTSRTDIGAAIQLGLALLPADAQKRVVLLSDGAENQGRAIEAARFATLRGIPIEVVPLKPQDGPDVLVAALVAPPTARAGQDIPLSLRLVSGVAGPARVEVFADGQLVASQEVTLAVGQDDLRITLPAGEAGFRRFEARISAPADSQPLNNSGVAFTEVAGPPRVLLVTPAADRAAPLRAALEAGSVGVDEVAPAQTPADPAELGKYAAVFLVDTPAAAMPPRTQQALATYVRDQGGGLAMIGGTQSFGAGGWRRTPIATILPVELDPQSRDRLPDLALALVIDRSGSMGETVGVGRNRLDLAKDAVFLAAQGLASRDQLGIYFFDDLAQTALPMQPLPDLSVIEEALGGMSIGGGTNIRGGIEWAAPVLAKADARVKHMLLLTDGLDSTDYGDLIDQMRSAGLTVTIVSIGGDANPSLEGLAERGGGAFYRVEKPQDVPQIFLSETVRAAGRDIVEEPLTPAVALDTPPVRGLGGLPPLYGYDATTPRESARTILLTPGGDPLLAVWQVGLGRSLAWTSDLKGQWAADWVRWEGFAPFAQGLVDALLPPPTAGRLSLEARADGARAVFNLAVSDADGRPAEAGAIEGRLVDPAGSAAPLRFAQVAPGRYRAEAPADLPGVYLAQVAALDPAGQALGAATGGLAVSYSPEYGPGSGGQDLLADLAAATGGRADPPPVTLFEATGQQVGRVTEIGLPLLWLALVLLPIDVALRRLFLGRRELAPLLSRLRPRAPAPTATSETDAQRLPADALLARLQTARTRARRPPTPTAPPETPASPTAPPAPPPPESPPPPARPDDPVAALLAAKGRRRR